MILQNSPIYTSPQNAFAVFYDPIESGTGQLVYYDGHWRSIDQTAADSAVITTMWAWYNAKKDEEARIAALCAKHPGLKDAKTAYEVMLHLAKTG